MEEDNYLLDFIEATGTDYQGRSIKRVWSFDDRQIDSTHDFIQWLFPLPLEKPWQLSRPTITPAGENKIRASRKAMNNMNISQDWYLGFLSRNKRWLSNYNHNHLRITRLLKSSTIFFNVPHSENLYLRILTLAGRDHEKIGAKALAHWALALNH